MILNSPYVTGSLTVTGNITASGGITISGSIASSSYATNADRLDNLDSTSFVFTSSYNTDSASVSTRVTKIEGNYATTGSNVFMGAQTVCANITSTGTIIAQTLNVQQVTSSIVYSSGSNIFGCLLTDRQQFTGSVLVTGSLTVTTSGTSPEFQVVTGGTIKGNALTDVHQVTGSLRITGSGVSVSSSVTIGRSTTNVSDFTIPIASNSLTFRGNYWNSSTGNREITAGEIYGIPLSSNIPSDPCTRIVIKAGSTDVANFLSNGNVGIGISPSYRLHVNSGIDGISAGIAGSTYGIRFDNGGTFSSGMSTIHGVDSTLIGTYQPIMLNGLDVRFGTSATERMRITSAGNIIVTNTTGLTTAAISTAGIFLGNTASTSGTSLFVKTDSVNTSLASGFGVNGTYAGGLSRIFLRAIGSISTGGYASAFSFMLDNNGTIRTAMQLDSDKVMRLYGPIDAVIPNADIAVGSAHNLRWDGIAGFSATIINTGGQPYVNYAFNNGYISAPQNLNGSGNRLLYSDPNGIITNSSSDITLKKNVENITYGLSSIMCLRPVFYNWIPESLGEQKEIGFIAQEVQEIIPEVVGKNWNSTLSLDYPKLTAVLTKAVQELKCQNDIFKTCLGIG